MTMANDTFLRVERLAKRFPSGSGELTVFDRVDFGIAKGEFVCIIGHSGCGKTTILNVLAGLMPWLTVMGNVAFAVRSRWPQWSRSKVETHAHRFIGLVGLAGAEHKKPAELSGGMKQRVGIARAFAIEPKMLLLDEPFGALDALTRGVIQDELLKIVQATHQTVFMITHDVDEAILLADRILLMSNGPQARVAEIVKNTMSAG